MKRIALAVTTAVVSLLALASTAGASVDGSDVIPIGNAPDAGSLAGATGATEGVSWSRRCRLSASSSRRRACTRSLSGSRSAIWR